MPSFLLSSVLFIRILNHQFYFRAFLLLSSCLPSSFPSAVFLLHYFPVSLTTRFVFVPSYFFRRAFLPPFLLSAFFCLIYSRPQPPVFVHPSFIFLLSSSLVTRVINHLFSFRSFLLISSCLPSSVPSFFFLIYPCH